MMNIKISLKTSLLVTCLVVSTNALADEKLWTVSTGLAYNHANYNLPGNKFSNESWAGNLGISRIIDDKTTAGGSISYSKADTRYNTLSGSADIDTSSVSVYLMRNIIWQGLYASGSLGYGKSAIDTNTALVNYNTDAAFKSASIGLMQYIPIGQKLMGSASISYSHISSDSDRFITNLGNAVPSSSSTLNYVTLGGKVTYPLNNWSPFVGISWNKASKEFIRSTGDKDYFSYSLGTQYRITRDTGIGLSLGSVVDKRYANETSASISLSHQF